MISEEILIPKSRVAVLIGVGGKVKRAIEKFGKVKLIFDENLITITAAEAVNLWTAKKVVEAIGRGCNPEAAKLLFREEYDFYLINLSEFGSTEKNMRRIRGRVIGENGTTRKKIQEYTNTNIAIQGKTIAIVGRIEDVQLARQAIEMILEGAKQTTAYYFIEKQKESKHAVEQTKD